jgi:hypothetical protein
MESRKVIKKLHEGRVWFNGSIAIDIECSNAYQSAIQAERRQEPVHR